MANPKFEAWYRDFPARFAPFKPSTPDPAAKHYRLMKLDHTRAQDAQRTIEATLSTDAPCPRAGYREILKHTPDAVDLSRAADGLPLLWSHNPEQQIGVAENVRVHEGRLRARLRFSESPLGEEKWRDVQAGILKGISIGYFITEYSGDTTGEYQEDITATRWTPFEVSAVTVPADIKAGFGRELTRALEQGALPELPIDLDLLMEERGVHNRYDFYVRGIEKLPSVTRAVDELQRMIAQAKTLADWNECGDLIAEIHRRASTDSAAQKSGHRLIYNEDSNMSKYEPFFINKQTHRYDDPVGNFSLCRALAMTFDPQAARAGGPEIEVMQEFARSRGKPMTGEALSIPHEILFRSVTKGGSGADLVGVDHMGSQFIEALRDTLVTGRLGAMILSGLQGDVSIPRQLTDSTAGWIAGDGADAVAESDPTLDSVSLAPKTVGAFSVLSRKMILQSSPAAEQILRETLSYAVAKAIDTACLVGTGASNQPRGITLTSGINSGTYTGSPTFADLVDMEGSLLTDNVDMRNLGYVTTGAMAATLKKTPVVSAQDRMIWSSNGAGMGVVNGYQAIASNLAPAGSVIFGNWRELMIGLWSGLDITVDPYTLVRTGSVQVVIMQDADVAVRHPASFAMLSEA